MKTTKSLQKKIKRGRTSKKYNIIKQKGGGFQLGDDVINYETKERGKVIRIEESSVGDFVIIQGWNVKNPKVHNSHLKLYTEYESQERERKLFEAYQNKDKDPETYERLKQEEAMAKQATEEEKRRKDDERQKAIRDGQSLREQYCSIPTQKEDFKIGDRVVICYGATYGKHSDKSIPLGSIVRIKNIRHRFKEDRNEYKQYEVEFNNSIGVVSSDYYEKESLRKYGSSVCDVDCSSEAEYFNPFDRRQRY
jgi:hypothetical protein